MSPGAVKWAVHRTPGTRVEERVLLPLRTVLAMLTVDYIEARERITGCAARELYGARARLLAVLQGGS